jgi:hypothetical protein
MVQTKCGVEQHSQHCALHQHANQQMKKKQKKLAQNAAHEAKSAARIFMHNVQDERFNDSRRGAFEFYVQHIITKIADAIRNNK